MKSGMTKVTLPGWNGDWERFKRMFIASARLHGVSNAVKAGEEAAKAKQNVVDQKIEPEEAQNDAQTEADLAASNKSPMLAAMLMTCLGETHGVQQGIVIDALEENEDGINAWARLVTHFEFSMGDIQAETLSHAWEQEKLQTNEHPDVLWTRLTLL